MGRKCKCKNNCKWIITALFVKMVKTATGAEKKEQKEEDAIAELSTRLTTSGVPPHCR